MSYEWKYSITRETPFQRHSGTCLSFQSSDYVPEFHHFVMWLAAKMADPKRSTPFKDYAILGDDVLITNDDVAVNYRWLLDKLGVSISDSKSIVSKTGCIQFAKKFRVKAMQVDLSPVSLRSLLCVKSTIGICQIGLKYNCTMSVLQRLGGAGYRVLSRLMSTQSKRWERIKAVHRKLMGQRGQLPFEFWLGRGMPLNPYLRGKMIAYLRKELKLAPDELLFDGQVEFNERTVLRNWMSQWLDWVYWYYSIAMSENVQIEDFFNAPVCATSWRRSLRDQTLVNFGVTWKLYDMAAGWSISICFGSGHKGGISLMGTGRLLWYRLHYGASGIINHWL